MRLCVYLCSPHVLFVWFLRRTEADPADFYYLCACKQANLVECVCGAGFLCARRVCAHFQFYDKHTTRRTLGVVGVVPHNVNRTPTPAALVNPMTSSLSIGRHHFDVANHHDSKSQQLFFVVVAGGACVNVVCAMLANASNPEHSRNDDDRPPSSSKSSECVHAEWILRYFTLCF